MMKSYACSSAGLVRENNEDCFVLMGRACAHPEAAPEQSARHFSCRWLQWYAVMDGMGGEALGEAAAWAAAKKLARWGGMLRWGKAELAADRLTLRMNAAVHAALRGETGGATLAMVFLRGRRLYACHAGDSRVYLLRDGMLTRLTQDHVPGGLRGSRRSHTLLRYLGMEDAAPGLCQTDRPLTICKGDRILLCSDGLSDMLSDGAILRLWKQADSPQAAGEGLLRAAMEAGGGDNATLVVIHCGK